MVRHIVMWNLIEGAKGNTKEENFTLFREKAQSMLGNIDGLLSMEVFRGYKGHEVVLIADFTDREAEAAYQPHPLHEKVKALGAEIFTDRAVIDFEM